jgi:hypothetical protein
MTVCSRSSQCGALLDNCLRRRSEIQNNTPPASVVCVEDKPPLSKRLSRKRHFTMMLVYVGIYMLLIPTPIAHASYSALPPTYLYIHGHSHTYQTSPSTAPLVQTMHFHVSALILALFLALATSQPLLSTRGQCNYADYAAQAACTANCPAHSSQGGVLYSGYCTQTSSAPENWRCTQCVKG